MSASVARALVEEERGGAVLSWCSMYAFHMASVVAKIKDAKPCLLQRVKLLDLR